MKKHTTVSNENYMEHGAIIKHNIKKSPRTGSWRYIKPEVDKGKCIGCTTCVAFCPDACIEMVEYKKEQEKKTKLPARIATRSVAGVDYEFCKGCGVCAQVCPVKAITMKKN